MLRRYLPGLLALGITGVLALGLYAAFLDWQVRDRFEGARWSLPARVFARPLEIRVGQNLKPEDLIEEVRLLRYRKDSTVSVAGTYWQVPNRITLHTRGFPFSDGEEPGGQIRIYFKDQTVSRMSDRVTGAPVDVVRLEPVPIASIYPQHNEDRVLVRLADVPVRLIDLLLAVEDRDFYGHPGIDFTALLRALWVNLRAGEAVQGGSTLTQQLVKNYFLSNERTLWRKFNEAIMALSLEWHYDKDEILQAYLNEVYLGQDGKRAIHGFALASQFYFEKRLQDLSFSEQALLVGMIKGPSHYNPRRHPERALERRNLVLSVGGRGSPEGMASAIRTPLGVTASPPSGTSPFPAVTSRVRRELAEVYRESDLRNEGLLIFTSMDPVVQVRTEQAVVRRLARLDRGASDSPVQAAAVVARIAQGEIVALVGGRQPRFAGYNRALDARRPVGSLIKPVVYLSALSRPQRYTLATVLDDAPLTVRLPGGRHWSPQNYDKRYHGEVVMREALARSLNVSTARLGLDVGVEQVRDTLYALGAPRAVEAYPSVLLGAAELAPVEVAQIYQALGARGLRVPLTLVREVTSHDGRLLRRNALRARQVADAGAVFLVNHALWRTVVDGTAKALPALLPGDLAVAGKTGTTDDMRDSWFAGFSGEHVAVVWVGRDDNRPTGLSGAAGALPIWGDVMGRITTRSLDRGPPPGVELRLIDRESGLLADRGCTGAASWPFIAGSAPEHWAPCAAHLARSESPTALEWLQGLFD